MEKITLQQRVKKISVLTGRSVKAIPAEEERNSQHEKQEYFPFLHTE